MALQLHFAALSQAASVDQQTGHLSIFELVDEIRTHQLPITLQSLVISVSLTKTDALASKGKLFIHFLTPDKKQHLVGTGDMSVPADQRRLKAVFRFGNFPINAYGSFRFVLSWMSEQGVKEGEALLDFDVIHAVQIAQGMPETEKPPVSH